MNSIREELEQLAETEFQKFEAGLVPGVENILGVRLPLLRKLAKRLAAGQWQAYLVQANDTTFEEIMLQGMVIGYLQTGLPKRLQMIADFVPKINNWSVCDSFCKGLKFTENHRDEVWSFLQPYLNSEKEFEVRFGLVMLLFYYIDGTYLAKIFKIADSVKQDGYYVKMAVAWLISMCYVNFPQQTMVFLRKNSMDEFTYQKSLQKIVESLSVSPEEKERIRAMKKQKRK